MANNDFKGVWIPREIWDDEKLNMLEKAILCAISNLDVSEDGCWASNEYLAGFCHCSRAKVAAALTKFKELGYIQRIAYDGRHRKLKSRSLFSGSLESTKYKSGIQKVDANNINNNKKNNTPPRKRGVREMSPSFLEFWKVYPRKVAKQTAWKAWFNAGLENEGQAELVLSDVKKKLDGEWEDKEIRYIPHPATYLNQRRWEDDCEEGMTEHRPSWWELPIEEQQALADRLADEYWENEEKERINT